MGPPAPTTTSAMTAALVKNKQERNAEDRAALDSHTEGGGENRCFSAEMLETVPLAFIWPHTPSRLLPGWKKKCEVASSPPSTLQRFLEFLLRVDLCLQADGAFLQTGLLSRFCFPVSGGREGQEGAADRGQRRRKWAGGEDGQQCCCYAFASYTACLVQTLVASVCHACSLP